VDPNNFGIIMQYNHSPMLQTTLTADLQWYSVNYLITWCTSSGQNPKPFDSFNHFILASGLNLSSNELLELMPEILTWIMVRGLSHLDYGQGT